MRSRTYLTLFTHTAVTTPRRRRRARNTKGSRVDARARTATPRSAPDARAMARADEAPLLPRARDDARDDAGDDARDRDRDRDASGRRGRARVVAIAVVCALGACAAIARGVGANMRDARTLARDDGTRRADDARATTATATTARRRARERRRASGGRANDARDAMVPNDVSSDVAKMAPRARGMWIDAVERVDAERDAEGVDGVATTRGRWIPTKVRVAENFTAEDVDGDAIDAFGASRGDADADARGLNVALEAVHDEVWIENYGQAKRRRERAKFLRAHGVDPKRTSATKAFAALGATRDDCPAAYFAPKVGAASLGGPVASELPEHFTKFSVHAVKLAAMADHIYILCTECSLGIPEEWRSKTSFVHGFRIDECLKTQGNDHWHKASFSHAHALMDAQKNKHKTVAIIEEDVITRDFADGGVGWRMLLDNMGLVRDTMRSEKNWTTIRVGYRAMFIDRPIESVSKLIGAETCPKDCRCETKNTFTCIMRTSGCDMRSSDFYIVRDVAYQPIIDKVYQGFTVDCEALRGVPNQVYITPQLSFQGTLDLKLKTQIQMAEDFMKKCAADGGA